MLAWVVSAILLVPVLAGLAGVALPALGYWPALGHDDLSLDAFRKLVAYPGFVRAIGLSLFTGVLSTALAVLLTFAILASGGAERLRATLGPMLAIPHAAAAFGAAFLFAPAGLISRLIAQVLGWDRPPGWSFPSDTAGLSLVAGLVVKETPFLLLMALAALPQLDAFRAQSLGASLGYRRVAGFALGIWPRLYQMIRLPVLLVLTYGLSTVDLALILGPTTPPTLAVLVVDWNSMADLDMRLMAAAGAVSLAALVLVAIVIWRMIELLAAWTFAATLRSGMKWAGSETFSPLGHVIGVLLLLTLGGALAVLGVWSVSGLWTYPDVLPQTVTLQHWQAQWGAILTLSAECGLIALLATGFAVVLTIALYEKGQRVMPVILYLPLVTPQVAFLPGLQVLMLYAGLDQGLVPVLCAHLVFVLPYVLLLLSGPYAARDERFDRVGAALGVGPVRRFWRIGLPLMLTPLLAATAVGLAVSIAQFLPTLLIGGGRVATLTTEALALTSGADRRVIGVFALAQTIAALAPFALAAIVPLWIWRNRRAMQ